MADGKPARIMDERAKDCRRQGGENVEIIRRSRIAVTKPADNANGNESHVILQQCEEKRRPKAIVIKKISHRSKPTPSVKYTAGPGLAI
jgi:hypothetical protein